MKSINDFLSYKSRLNEMIRSDELEKLTYKIISEMCLKDFVQNVIITDFNKNKIYTSSFAFYDGESIYFDYLKIIYLIVNTMPDGFSTNWQADYINLKLLSIMLHEIYHVMQKRKVVLNPQSLESRVIKYAYKKKNKLFEEKRYTNKFYETNPMERQASIKSLKKILDFYKNNEELISRIILSLDAQILNGYDKNDSLNVNPCNTYFEQKIDFIKENNELSYEKRIELGLPVKAI